MNNKTKSFAVTILIFLITNTCFSRAHQFGILKIDEINISVGTKTNDSSGIVTISNTQIQTNIIPSITLLNGATVTDDNPTISVGSGASYLLFKAVRPNQDTVNVAIELSLSTSNAFSVKSQDDRKVHIAKSYGRCVGCSFAKDKNNIIYACSCNGMRRPSYSLEDFGCKYWITIIQ